MTQVQELDWQEPRLETHTLSVRLTHGYVGTYRHMDKWMDIGTLTVLARGSYQEGDDIEESTVGHLLVSVELDQPEPLSRILQAIRSVFGRHGCAHEYDCCGCWSTGVMEVAHAYHNVYAVQTSSSRNY